MLDDSKALSESNRKIYTDQKLLEDTERRRAEQFKEINEREKILKRKEDVQKEAAEQFSKTKEGKYSANPGDSFINFVKKDLDLTYINKILNELKNNTNNYAEREELFDEYKKLTMYCIRNLEGKSGGVRKVDQDNKQLITREINRVFNEKFEKAEGFREYIQRMVHYRLEDLRREVKDNKWKIYLSFLTEFLRKNPKNRDLLEKIKFKVTRDDPENTGRLETYYMANSSHKSCRRKRV